MQRHPRYELWLHDDAELAAALGSPIVARTTIHQWPLSCVQRIECEGGKTYIYKVQAPPTVEPAFYEQARSPLLVEARTLPLSGGPPALVLEDVRESRLCDLHLPAVRSLAIVEDVLGQIGQIAGELPTLADIRTKAGWDACAATILANLRAVFESGKQPSFTSELVEQVDERSRAQEVSDVYQAGTSPMGYVHNDLLGSNVLLVGDGYRVLDWQRPIWGPVAIDRATLVESARLDPRPHVLPGILLMRWVLRIGFYAEAAKR